MTRVCGWILLALSLGSSGLAAEDVIYKCARPGGEVAFSDKPCGEAKHMQQIKIEPAPLPDITNVQPLCASEVGARLDIARLDAKVLAAMPVVQRASTQEALAEYARSGSRAGARWGRGEQQAVHLCLPTFADEIVEYVATTDGKLVQMRAGMVSYLNDPDTPRALLNRCADTWKLCLSAPGADPDSCMSQMPTCASSEPWKGGRNCCPLQCKTDYQTRREGGVAGETAFLAALYGNPSCVPGVGQ